MLAKITFIMFIIYLIVVWIGKFFINLFSILWTRSDLDAKTIQNWKIFICL